MTWKLIIHYHREDGWIDNSVMFVEGGPEKLATLVENLNEMCSQLTGREKPKLGADPAEGKPTMVKEKVVLHSADLMPEGFKAPSTQHKYSWCGTGR